MKRLAVITTSLLLTLSSFGGGFALAEGSEAKGTVYPQDDFVQILEFDNLSDYEIDGDTYYFLDGETCYMYENGEKYEVDEPVQFSEVQYTVDIGEGENRFTYRLDGSSLKVWGENDEIVPIDGEFSLLKRFADSAYAVKENKLYQITGTKAQEVTLDYIDYSVTETILIGHAAADLKNYTLTFVNVKKGAYITEIDLNLLDRAYFKLDYSWQKKVDKENGLSNDKEYSTPDATHKVEEDMPALLLCYTGNAAIIAVDDTGYILLNDKTTIEEIPLDSIAEEHITYPEYNSATISGLWIHASPFAVAGTIILDNAAGTTVTVKSRVQFEGVLDLPYCEVEFTTSDGTVKTGYVAERLLENEQVIDYEGTTHPDDKYSEATNVTPVLLVLAVVILVLVAVGYLIFTATSGKRRGKKKEAAATDGGKDENKDN